MYIKSYEERGKEISVCIIIYDKVIIRPRNHDL